MHNAASIGGEGGRGEGRGGERASGESMSYIAAAPNKGIHAYSFIAAAYCATKSSLARECRSIYLPSALLESDDNERVTPEGFCGRFHGAP